MQKALSGVVRKENGLSHRQAVAIPYIASEATLAQGANAAQVARSTLARWMREPAFRAELERIRENIADLAYTELEGLTLKSVMRLDQLLDDPDPNVRHRARKTSLSLSLNVRVQRDLRQQLETVENVQAMMRQQR